jgi:hypothetical protein
VPKNLQFTNKLSSSALGYNNQYLFNQPGHFTLVSISHDDGTLRCTEMRRTKRKFTYMLPKVCQKLVVINRFCDHDTWCGQFQKKDKGLPSASISLHHHNQSGSKTYSACYQLGPFLQVKIWHSMKLNAHPHT